MKINKKSKIIWSLVGLTIVVYLIFVGIAMKKQNINTNSNVSNNNITASENVKNTDKINTGVTENVPLEVANIEYYYSYSGSKDYLDIKTTIKNVSNKSINYIKLNLYFKDGNGNIVDSDWTNCSATIKPNATQIITKTVKITGDWKTVRVEVDNYSFE